MSVHDGTSTGSTKINIAFRTSTRQAGYGGSGLDDLARPRHLNLILITARNSNWVAPAEEERMTILHTQGGGENGSNWTVTRSVFSYCPDIVVVTTNQPCPDPGEIVLTVQAMKEIRLSLVDLFTAIE